MTVYVTVVVTPNGAMTFFKETPPLPRGMRPMPWFTRKQSARRNSGNDSFYDQEPPSFAFEAERLYGILNPAFGADEGLIVHFIGVRPGDGASTMAREFAIAASHRVPGSVLLLNFDWGNHNSHYEYFADFQQAMRYGMLGPPEKLEADPDTTLRFTRERPREKKKYHPWMTFHRVGETSLLVSCMDITLKDPPRVTNQPHFWETLRKEVALVVVDTPPMSRSWDGIVLSRMMDAVILVVAAEATRIPMIEDFRDKLIGQGAPLIGMIFNQRRFYIPKTLCEWFGYSW